MSWTDKIAKFFLGRLTKKGQRELTAKVRRDSDKIVASERKQYLTCLANEVAHDTLHQEQSKSVHLTQRILEKMPTRKLPDRDDEPECTEEEHLRSNQTDEFPPLAAHGA